jgi:ubiquinone biosynthesis protein COQ4
MADDTPYLLRGLQKREGSTTLLSSTSKYLDEPRMRDWVAMALLRRSGKDVPTTSDAYKLYHILRDLEDNDRIEELFTQSRKENPALDKWFNDRHISNYTAQDLVDQYPPGSIGYNFGRYLLDNGFSVDIVPRYEPKTQYEFYNFRSGQTHDLEHVICGGGFDILGELVPGYARLSNVPRFLNAELCGVVNAMQIMLQTRIAVRTQLHYPQSWPTAMKAIQLGMAVGEQSDCAIFMIKYEDVFHLPLEEARAALGIKGAYNLDSHAASLEWDEYQ